MLIWLPDSFVLVAILTLFVFLSVWGFTSQDPLQIVQNLGFFELVISAIFAKEIAKRLKVWIIVCL
ncbi:TIGR00366 family protein [Campylobacter upsaliensis]|uniref:TIGR00366 family protein n=1 Tax=Campylobacter upsaliensis TaxID=28080 RepID=UPI0022EA5185|nr:TIGR00366 family protein [Campylobacter upsaliensis]